MRVNTFTGDDSYLEPYNTAEGVIEDFVQTIEPTAENPHREVRFNTLDPLVAEWLETIQQVNIAVARYNNGFEAA